MVANRGEGRKGEGGKGEGREGATHGPSDVPRLLMGRASEGKEGAGVEE